MAAKTTDVSTVTSFDDDALSRIKSIADASELLTGSGVEVEKFADYGNGFVLLETKDKDKLIGEAFVIVQWRFQEGDNGEFVTLFVVTRDGGRYIVNDGSTGIRDQLKSVTAQRERAKHKSPQMGLVVDNGLSRSDYRYADTKTGESRPASTYYLAN